MVLQGVAESIPVPGVAITVKIATGLVETCDVRLFFYSTLFHSSMRRVQESNAALEGAEDLKDRITKVMEALVRGLEGKKAEDIEERLKKDIKSLGR